MNPHSASFFAQLRELIANDDLPTALRLLRSMFENSPKLDEALQQSGRWNDIRRQVRLGTISHEDATLTKNQIRLGLLDFIKEIEEKSPAHREEMEQALNHKTVTQHAEKIYNIDKIDNANFS